MKVLITGGAGFIGSALVRHLIGCTDMQVVNLDLLTYAGNLRSLAEVESDPNYTFIQGDIRDRSCVDKILRDHQPDSIMHLAAESHVDRSIDSARVFVETNVLGTLTLLEAAREYWDGMVDAKRELFRFLHVSTDEVYGDLTDPESLFTENTRYSPSSPYSASKASSDHLVRAWARTYGLPILLTNCSNNYGPYQFPEKLIPHMILNILEKQPLPIYGDGRQIRDWLYVEDHVEALTVVLEKGNPGETYNIGGHNEISNLEVVRALCKILEEQLDTPEDFSKLITHVADRPGHDTRYAIDAAKIQHELGWVPKENFESGIRKTVSWYLQNTEWWGQVLDGSYRLRRIGVAGGQ